MNDYEKTFLEKCIISSKRERLRYELNTPNKRNDFLMRFCHDAKRYIVSKNILFYGPLNELFLKISAKEPCNYILSTKYFNGTIMNFLDMQNYILNEYMSAIVVTKSYYIIKEEANNKSMAYLIANK